MASPSSSFSFNDLLLGTDLVEVSRLKKAFSCYGQVFFAKMLTPLEMEHCFTAATKESVSIQRAAGRIAVKEAVSKALGSGLNGLGWGKGVDWREIEVVSGHQQPPRLKLHAGAQALAEEMQVRDWRISLSHDGQYAIATVIGLIQRN
jgi:holo-[acyl-carrier protein] synthase